MAFPPILLKQLASSMCDPESSAALRTVDRKTSVAFNPKKKVPVGDECGFCGSSDRSLKSCSCRLVCYCSESCQAAHWKAEPYGHKDRCVAPADRKPSAFQPEKAKNDVHSSQDLCGVCFGPLLADNVLRSGAPHAGTQTLVCNHSFHLKCASEWESSSQSSLCPLCRGQFSSMPVETLFLEAVKPFLVIENLVDSGHYSWDTLPLTMKIKMHSVFRKCFEAANRGHMLAQVTLSNMYYDGQGVKQDFNEAAKWCRRAADQGLAHAQFNLGSMYEKGRGIKQNFKEAVKWYRKAADQGEADAQFNLGCMNVKGQGVKQNFREAVKCYRKAADQGDAGAQCNLGCMYESGQGVKRDYREAVKWFQQAADQRHPEAQRILGLMYEKGQGVKQNSKEASKWYQYAGASRFNLS